MKDRQKGSGKEEMATKDNASELDKRRLLTPDELARELVVSKAWIRDHVSGRRQPLLPHIRLGGQRGQIRFRRRDIDEFLEANLRNYAAVERKEV